MRASVSCLVDFAKGTIRTSSFFFKEIWAAIRQPRLILSVLLGPFLILAAFGIGYRGQTPSRYAAGATATILVSLTIPRRTRICLPPSSSSKV